ncbi:helix-turn-helix domain-containing protein [Kitasatospora sp. McL0602]|uniref:helix-turn-helix domain-containing protein n=1 Tax=Kitasatospora sp. McL0602 TaxID=3439530 RepID=UPI003F8CE771
MGFSCYLTPSEEHRRLGLVCLGAGWQRVHRMNFDGRVLNCYGLMMVTRGAGWFSWGRHATDRLPVEAPAAFVVFPGLYHRYQPDPEGWSERWVLFDGPAASAHESLGTLDRDHPVIRLGPDVRPLLQTFDTLNSVVSTNSPHRHVTASALVHQLLAQLLAAKVSTDLSRVVRYLDEHAAEPVAIREHARRLGLDEEALRREVRRATGGTPKGYIVQARLSRAKDLLLTTDRSVREVARDVGFDDPAYFSRLFGRRVGQSPAAFREAGRTDLAV